MHSPHIRWYSLGLKREERKVSNTPLSRRAFVGAVGLGAAALSRGRTFAATKTPRKEESAGMKLGMVTYLMGKDMDCPGLIRFCTETGLEGVELRATHAHGVELNLSKKERAEVRKMFADSPVELAGLGSAYEFHAREPAVVRRNVEDAKAYARLAADVGAPGIKVRPNRLFDDEDPDITCERIGKAWGEVAAFADELGVEVRMEVHGGGGSANPANIRKMLDHANHGNAKVCWNSNPGEQDRDGSVRTNFDLLKHAIGLVHINEIGICQYPWRELFGLLKGIGYKGYCLAEIPYNPEPERFMKYYRTLFDLYTGTYRYPRG